MSLADLEATPLPEELLEPQAAMAPAARTAAPADMRDLVPMPSSLTNRRDGMRRPCGYVARPTRNFEPLRRV
jgi:hypothetical protein